MPVERHLKPQQAVASAGTRHCNGRCLSFDILAAQPASCVCRGRASLQDAAGVRMRGLLDRVVTLLSSDADFQVGLLGSFTAWEIAMQQKLAVRCGLAWCSNHDIGRSQLRTAQSWLHWCGGSIAQ